MKKRRYNKKMLGLLILPFVVNSLTAGPASSADITPGAGDTLTLTGTNNVDRIMATGDNVTVTLATDAELTVDGNSPAISLWANSTVTLNTGSSITNTNEDSFAVEILNVDDSALTTNTVTLDDAEISAASTADNGLAVAVWLNDYGNGGTSTVSLDNGSTIEATSTSAPEEGSSEAQAYAIWADARNTTVTLDNSSSVSTSASATTTGFGGGSWVDTTAIYASAEDNGAATVSLDNSSSVSVTATATAAEYYGRVGSAIGVEVHNQDDGDVAVTLDNGSSVTVDATASVDGTTTWTTAYVADVYGIYAYTDTGDATVTLDNGSSVTVAATATNDTTGDNYAIAETNNIYGIYAESDDGATTVTLDNASSVEVTSITTSHDYSNADPVGIWSAAWDYGESTVTLSNGSSVSATAMATVTAAAYDGARANSEATGIYGYSDYNVSTITLDNSTVEAIANSSVTSTTADEVNNTDAWAWAEGIYGGSYAMDMIVTLDNSTVSATAVATNNSTASSEATNNDADADAYGIYAYTEYGDVMVTLADSTVEATATATATGASDGTNSEAWADSSGIYAYGYEADAIVSLTNSSVTSTATASAPDDADADADGIYAGSDYMDTLVTLDNSSVEATAIATSSGAGAGTDNDSYADAHGIRSAAWDDGESTVSLANGSSVSATATATVTVTTASESSPDAGAYATGIYGYSDYNVSTITLDNSTVEASANSSVTSTTADEVDNTDARAWAEGIYGGSYTLDMIVTLDNSTVSATAVAVNDSTASSSAWNNNAWADAYGIYAYTEYGGDVMVTLTDSTVEATATATAASDGTAYSVAGADAYGIWAEGYEADAIVSLTNSSVTSTATASAPNDAWAWAEGIYAYSDYMEASVTLDNSSVEATAVATANGEGFWAWTGAWAGGVSAYTDDELDAVVTLDNASTVSATATATGGSTWAVGAWAVGIGAWADDADVIVSLDNGSSSIGTAIADGGETAYAGAYGIYVWADDNAAVTLSNGSSSTGIATATASGGGLFDAVETADVFDMGTAIAPVGYFYYYGGAVAWADGIDVDSGYYDATVILDASSATAIATATNTGDGYYGAYATTNGIDVDAGQLATISLSNGSTVTADSTATAQGTGSGAYATALGMEVWADEQINISLDNSSVSATATATGDTTVVRAAGIYAAYAYGDWGLRDVSTDGSTVINLGSAALQPDGTGGSAVITLDNGSSVSATGGSADYQFVAGIYVAGLAEAVITLSNGSSVSATGATGGSADYQYVAGIYVADVAEAVINIDATSSVSGSDYAILSMNSDYAAILTMNRDAILSMNSDLTVNNDGLISGRILAGELVNSATGVLQANLSADSAQMINGVNEDGSFYNTITSPATASLADGSTVAIGMNDPVAAVIYEGDPLYEANVIDYGLGLTGPGETVVETGDGNVASSVEYRILTAGAGDWTLANINLEQAEGNSPMLDLQWSALCDDDNLFMEATFLTPAQAGLSQNGTAAFNAAYADGLFTFDSSPEGWVPDASGANVSGQLVFVGASGGSIGERLASLNTGGDTGVNTGDATATHGVWADVRYTDAEQNQRNNIEGFDADTKSLTMGFDHQINNRMTLGAAFSYGQSDVETNVSKSDFDMDDSLLTIYGSYTAASWFTEAQISYGWGDVDAKRVVGGTTLKADYDSDVYSARIAAGRNYLNNDWTITPKAALDYTRVNFDNYRETGGSMALNVATEDYNICNIGAGVQLERTLKLQGSMTMTPQLSAMVYYDLVGDKIQTTSSFVGGTTTFITEGADPDRTTIDVAAGLTFGSLKSPLSFNVGYEYIGRVDFGSHTINGKFRYEF